MIESDEIKATPKGKMYGASESSSAMKQLSERKIENAVKVLLQALQRQVEDTAAVLDQYEASHSEYEADRSPQYGALVEGHFAVMEAIEKLNRQLNKKRD